MSYSNTGGGTLTLPSPTSVHHVDVSAAVRSLRRSLSRSPSKFHLMRTASDSSSGSPSNSPQSPSPQSPCPQPTQHHQPSQYPVHQPQRSQGATSFFTPGVHSTTPTSAPPTLFQSPSQLQQQPVAATPFRPNVKLSLRSARPKAASAKPLSRTRPSPRSPLKRVLSSSNDAANTAAPPTGAPNSDILFGGQENSNFNSFALAFSQAARSTLHKAGSRHSMHLDLSGASKASSSTSRFLDVKSETYPTSTVSPLKRTDSIMNVDQASLGSPVAKRRSLHGISSLGADFNVFDHGPPTPAPAARTSFEIHEDGNHEYKLTGSGSITHRDLAPPPSPTPSSSVPKRSSSLRKSTLQQRHDPRSSWGKRQGERYLAQQSPEVSTPIHRNKQPRASLDQFLQADVRDSPFSSRGPLPSASAHPMDRPPNPPHQPHPLSRTLTTASMTTSSSGSSVGGDSPSNAPIQPPVERPRPQSIFAKSLPIGAHRPQGPLATPAYKSAKPLPSAFASTGLVSKMNRNPELGGSKMMMPDTPCKKHAPFQSINSPYNTYPPSSGSSRKKRGSLGASNTTPFSPVLQKVQPFEPFGSSERAGGFFKMRSRHGHTSSLLSFDGDFDSQGSGDGELPPTPTKQTLVTGPKSISAGAVIHSTPVANRVITPTASRFGSRVARTPSGLSSSPLEHAGRSLTESPKTPQETMMPPDASRLSISVPQDPSLSRSAPTFPPATPTTTAGRGSVFSVGDRRAITPVNGNGYGAGDIDSALTKRFTKIESIGQGEFSQVFRVCAVPKPAQSAIFAGANTPPTPQPERVYAVKKLRHPYSGAKDREIKMQEVSALMAVRDCDNVLSYVDHWEDREQLYIQTEFCDEGNLQRFLMDLGDHTRLDDFRIWKILLEIAQGLDHIHNAGFVHLDLKPANIFVSFDGTLKIGDFGMAAHLPIVEHDGEGDRQYIAPETLSGPIDKPADVFALGLITFEVAANVFLPDYGPDWLALRQGIISGIRGTLTNLDAQCLRRDATGMPLQNQSAPVEEDSRDDYLFGRQQTHDPSNLFGTARRTQGPQAFMLDEFHPGSLDNFCRWMIQPDPTSRPTTHEVLGFSSISWVSRTRLAPATVYEGNWGPGEKPASERPATMMDVEMMDV